MKQFIKLFDTMKINGYAHHQSGTVHKATDCDFEISCARPFVFDNDAYSSISSDDLVVPEELDAPFPIFAIEALKNTPLIINKSRTEAVICIVVKEHRPKHYTFYSLCCKLTEDRLSSPWILKSHGILDSNFEPDSFIGGINKTVKLYLDHMRSSVFGKETVGFTLKYKDSNKVAKFNKIKKIIYVSTKKHIKKNPESTRHVDWTHRFEVRGHWRKQDGLGKDREGNYCIDGYTWVVCHVRGDQSLPLIKKTRLVCAQEEAQQ